MNPISGQLTCKEYVWGCFVPKSVLLVCVIKKWLEAAKLIDAKGKKQKSKSEKFHYQIQLQQTLWFTRTWIFTQHLWNKPGLLS